jgi:hypothetical protein
MRKSVASPVLGLIGLFAVGTAEAHFQLKAIDMKTPVSWLTETDTTGGPQKQGPCAGTVMSGETAGKPTNVVTDVKAGQMVSISVNGTVGHPGWYRVSLVEGPSSSQTAQTLPDPTPMSGTNCTPPIVSNPVWSTTQPVIGDGLPPGSTAKTQQSGAQTLSVMIPKDANCTTAKPCTLQVIMAMTDHPVNSCYYHHCADITTSGGTTSGSGGGAGGSGAGAAGGRGTGGSSGASGSGGASASGGANGSGGFSGPAGTGGSSASGGAPGSGGSSSSGGASATGGALASGGATSSGGKSGSGGISGSGGSNTSSGSGGSQSPGADSSSSGCEIATRRQAPLAPLVGLLLVAIASRRRAR